MADCSEQHEQLLALEELHDQEDGPVALVDDQLVDLDHVLVLQFAEVPELVLHVQDHFLVARLDDFDRVLSPAFLFLAALHQSHGALVRVLRPAAPAR